MTAPNAATDEALVGCPRCSGCGVYDDEDAFGRTLHDVECVRCDGTGTVDADTLTVSERYTVAYDELGELIAAGGRFVCQGCQGEGCTVCGDTGLAPEGPVAA